MDTETLLQERSKTHGDFTEHARLTQALKAVWVSAPSYIQTTDIEREAVEMILHKIGRIGAGNPHYQDHWDDIAGYAKLVSQRLA